MHLLATDEGPIDVGPGAEAAIASLDQRVFEAIVTLVKTRPVLANSLEQNLRYCVLRELAQKGVQVSQDLGCIKLDPADLESVLGIAFECVVPDVALHTRSVAQRTICLSTDLGIDGERLKLVASGGLLHDVGKIDPDVYKLISQPRKLTDGEKTIVKMHPVIGQRVLQAFGVDPLICD